MDLATWEGVAEAFAADVGIHHHVHPRVIAAAYGLELAPVADRSGRHSCVRGNVIRVPALARPERLAGVLAHELGHVALEHHGEEDSEHAASFVGAALLVPRSSLLVALRCAGPDLCALRQPFPHASAELLARRVADVAPYHVSIIDGRRVRTHAPHVTWPVLVDARTTQAALHEGYAEDTRTRAWRVGDAERPRVIAITALE